MPLYTRVATRRKIGRWSLDPTIAFDPTTSSVSLRSSSASARVELGVEQIDLVADHVLPARLEDAGLHGQAVVGLADRQHAHLGVVSLDLLADLDGAVARAVLAQQQLVGPAERTQLLLQLQHRS